MSAFVIFKLYDGNGPSSCEPEVVAVRSTEQKAKVRIAEIAELIVDATREGNVPTALLGQPTLELDAAEDGSEVYLYRAGSEEENPTPVFTLSYIEVDDTDED